MRSFLLISLTVSIAAVAACSAAGGGDTASGSDAGPRRKLDGSTGPASDAGNGGPRKSSCEVTSFAASSSSFALPNLGASGSYRPFNLTANESSSIGDSDFVNYALLDVDGDTIPDLVVTERESDSTVGQSVWKVYKGNGTGFASASTDFALPNLGATGTYRPFNLTSNESSSISASDFVSYATLDIDADGKVDLVVTERESDNTVGQSVWKVFKGSGSGFAASSMDFALPSFGATGTYRPFNFTANSSSSISDSDFINYALVDVDGDTIPDIVVTERETDTTVGQSVWKVYKGFGAGFESSSTDFALPSFGATGSYRPFSFTANSSSSISETDFINYALVSVDGDAVPDLVVTERETDTTVGQSVWKVFKGTGSGYATSATDFALPNLGATSTYRPFNFTANQSSSVSETDYVNYALVDIDGDATPDLVVTEREADTTVGQSVWKVYKGSGTGYASSSTDFPLPSLGASGSYRPFNLTANQSSSVSASDYVNYALLDVNGDARLDLVVTEQESNANVGQSTWQVFNGSCK